MPYWRRARLIKIGFSAEHLFHHHCVWTEDSTHLAWYACKLKRKARSTSSSKLSPAFDVVHQDIGPLIINPSFMHHPPFWIEFIRPLPVFGAVMQAVK